LSDLQGQPAVTGVLKLDFSYSYAAVDKSLTDRARRAVPLR